jgi:predicted RNase H-like HicB family nuclease
MDTIVFVALAAAEPNGGYAASFPDAPDCEVRAGAITELLLAAREAITGHLHRLADAGEAWPTPTPVEQMSLAAGTIPLLVDISIDDRPIRVNVSLGERLVQRLDAAAEARGMTRSGFIAQAVRVSLGERGAANEFDATARRLQEELESLGRKLNESVGPGSAFSRRMAELDDKVSDSVRKAADKVSAAMSRRREARTAEASPSEGSAA